METKIVFLLFCWIQIISFDWVQGEVEYKCGKTPKRPTFIVGGDTVVGTWPWMASLGYFDEEEWIHKCGTTLIGKNFFLTAAHCVQELPPEWQILAGTDDLKLAKKGRYAKVFDIQHVVVHPQFNGNAYFDIALLRTQHVEFTEMISPVCLPNSPSNNEDEYKNNLMDVTGWRSATLTGDTSKSLERVSVKVYSKSYCNTTHIAGKGIPNQQKNVEISVPRLFQSQVMCAGQSTDLHGSCKEDSGGPLFLENPELESYFQIGVVHGGIAECGSKSFPSIYVRLDDPDIFQFIKINTQDASNKGYTKVAVALGDSLGDNPIALGDGAKLRFLDDIEVIDLSSSNTRCQNLQNFPYIHGDKGGLGFGDNPIICGGPSNKSSCHSLQNGSWKPDASFNQGRFVYAMTRSPFPNDGSKLFVTGGDNENSGLKSSEVLTENGWQFSTPLPVEIERHCMVMINSTSVMVIGGYQGQSYGKTSGRTFLLDGVIKVWREGPELKQKRSGHSCAVIRKDSQSQEESVIVVGGYDDNHNNQNSTEVYEVGSSEWKSGPELPFGISNAAMVEDPSGGVVLIGGWNERNEFLNTLFRLPHAGSDATWEEMPQKLKLTRTYHTAFLIPDEFANCD